MHKITGVSRGNRGDKIRREGSEYSGGGGQQVKTKKIRPDLQREREIQYIGQATTSLFKHPIAYILVFKELLKGMVETYCKRSC